MGVCCFAGGDAAKGKTLYAPCIACHAADGAGMKAVNSPSLVGQEEYYLIRQLKDFKAGVRGKDPKDIFGMQMQAMSMLLANDQAIADVAAYIATFKAAAPAKTVKGDAAKGKAQYTICATCHGPNAEGMDSMNSPKLTNLPDWYMVTQLKNFKSGIRGTNPKNTFAMQMRPMAMVLVDDAAIDNVVAYITSLNK